MNVLAFVHFHRLVNQTGVGRVASELLRAVSNEQEIDLRALGSEEDFKFYKSSDTGAQFKIETYLFPQSRKSQQARWLVRQEPKAEHYWERAEIVWCPAESYVPTSRACLVVTLHDAAHLESGIRATSKGHLAQRLKWTVMMNRLRRDAAYFTTVSRFSAERLLHFYPWLDGKIWIVPNAVPRRFLAPPSSEGDMQIKSFGLSNRQFILVPGGLTKQKNAELILAAWGRIRSRNPDVLLVIAGIYEPDFKDRAISIDPSIHILGYIDDEALRSLYEACTLVWFPSRYEGFGIPALEAMACGKALVASSAGAIPEVTGDAAVLLPPDKPELHAEAIVDLLQNPQLRLRHVTNGFERVKQYTWEKSSKQLVQAFCRAVDLVS